MRSPIRVNDFVCLRKSLKLSWKVYYIVVGVKGEFAECIRCSTTIPNTHIYTMRIDELALIEKCSIWLADYIKDQIVMWKQNIKDELEVELHLKKTNETMRLLTEDIKAVTFYTSGEDKHFYSFEIVQNPQPVLLPEPYRVFSNGKSRTKYEWIRIHIGRNFNNDDKCVGLKERLFQEDM